MHRFAQCTEIWIKFQNSVIHTSRDHNDEIAEVSQSWISYVFITIRPNYSEIYFLQNWVRILIWIIIDFIKIYRHIIYKTDYSNYFSFKHICVHILCRFSDTGIIMTKALLCTWPTKPCIDFIQCMMRDLPLRNFACKFRLRNLPKPNKSCHNRI